jgi:purine-cytosine permease-like protein
MLLSSLGAIAAFWLIYRGRSEKSYEMQAAGVGIVVVVAIILMRVTTNAQRRR